MDRQKRDKLEKLKKLVKQEKKQQMKEQREHEMSLRIAELKKQADSLDMQRTSSRETASTSTNGSPQSKFDEPLDKDVLRRSSSMMTEASPRMIDSTLDHSKLISTSKHPIYRVCLTGGACAGKTTALASLAEKLTKFGFNVLQVPEAATLMMKSGVFIQTHKMGLKDQVKFQIQIMRMQMSLEDIFLETAMDSEDKPTVILCDRGVMDGRGFTEEKLWQALLDETGWSTIQLRDRRYEAVIHMVTAADGAAKFYTDVNNEARYETAAQARVSDKKLINAWVGHPNFTIIGNNCSFQEKVEKTLDAVFKQIGLPTLQTFHKKFLLANVKGKFDINTPAHIKKEVFQAEETFLTSTQDKTEAFVRKNGKNDSYTYTIEIR